MLSSINYSYGVSPAKSGSGYKNVEMPQRQLGLFFRSKVGKALAAGLGMALYFLFYATAFAQVNPVPLPPAWQAVQNAWAALNTATTNVNNLQHTCDQAATTLQTAQAARDAAIQAYNNAVTAAFVADSGTNPVPVPVTKTESSNLTQVTPGSGKIIDSSLNVWTLDANQNILENGTAPGSPIGGWQSPQLVYSNHQVILRGLDGNWYALGAGNVPTKVAAPL